MENILQGTIFSNYVMLMIYVPNILFNRECDCKTKLPSENCTNPLDQDFKCPGYLEDAVVTLVSKSLLETYFRISQDNNSDNKDGQTK